MGQLQSSLAETGAEKFTPQQISSRFANQCGSQFSSIELWAFKDVFRRNAKVSDRVYYWTQEDLVRFLEIPENMAESGKILYAMVYYICTFPFLRPRIPALSLSQNAPTTLTFENMVKVVVLFTGRYKGILSSDYDFLKLLFCAISFYEEVQMDDLELKEKKVPLPESEPEPEQSETSDAQDGSMLGTDEEKLGFWEKRFSSLVALKNKSISSQSDTSSDVDIDEEFLTINFTNMASWYDLDLIKSYDNTNVELLRISPTSLYHLFILLLALGPLQVQEPIGIYASHFEEPQLTKYKTIAKNMVRSFVPTWTVGWKMSEAALMEMGISYSRFYIVIKSVMPFAFDTLATLFEHFLFNRRISPEQFLKLQAAEAMEMPEHMAESPVEHPFESPRDHDGLEESSGDSSESVAVTPLARIPPPTKLMSASVISQLATFMDTHSFMLYGGLKKLYVGSEAGFSMGSFEQKVFKWNAPTIVLISGYILPAEPKGTKERAFADNLPPIRYLNSNDQVKRHNGNVLYGAVVNTPWKNTNKECFGDRSTALFTLEPVHDVFRANAYNPNYVYFSKTTGLGFGSTPPKQNTHVRNGAPQYALGDLSLTLDGALEFGVFRHVGSETFKASDIREHVNFEDRFAVTEFEVWGCGADEVLREQAKLWAWEEREALLRKHVNLSKDREESRALLELAGIIGGGGQRTGGSI
ncbi:TLD-domain-containing protein [Lipomyces arxii]|uniref:TLD-domain-containing protein n=1 Tax=Lipomyces arxii TaxID=56418 RepID=UPI0034CE51A4